MQIYLWEYAPSPHLGNILVGMSQLGYDVNYVVNSDFYEDRKKDGWEQPSLPGVKIIKPTCDFELREIIDNSNCNDIHICVGIRANPYIRRVCSVLRKTRRRFFVFMETVSEGRVSKLFKRLMYRILFRINKKNLEGVLAAGESTPSWVVSRGVSRDKVFPFAYFLCVGRYHPPYSDVKSAYRLLYVGSLIERKQVDAIIDALADLPEFVTLDVVGDGDLRKSLTRLAESVAPGRVVFHGTRSMNEISSFMSNADCLVLSSVHDGWGAVASEAMLSGTPVVCSDRCGVSVAVRASKKGEVYPFGGNKALADALQKQIAKGKPEKAVRDDLAQWALCLSFPSGASYLESIISHIRFNNVRPLPPWDTV